jgi:chemotaxis protein CheD
MCQIAVGTGQDTLRATLGSCVGIGVLWRERSLYGLAHCLLAEEPRGAPVLPGAPAKYVSQAVPALMRMMGIHPGAHRAVEVVLVGGANMMTYARGLRHAPIGEQNVCTAQRLLEALGVRIVHTDVGGQCGRQLLIDGGRHAYAVRRLSRSTSEWDHESVQHQSHF